MFSNFNELFSKDKQAEIKKIALAVAQDKHALQAVQAAYLENIIEPILVGNREEIVKIAGKINFDITNIKIVHKEDNAQAVQSAVQLVRNGDAHILMKGNVATATLLKGVLNKEWGLRSGKILSHLALFEIKNYHKLLGITDVAMNIAPDLDTKIAILNNAVAYMNKIGVKNPKVAAISAAETVNSSMLSSVDAAIIAKMSDRKQLSDCIVDGPLALDNAISKKSAEHKGIDSKVAGDADLLLVPNIDAGNVLYKSLSFFADVNIAAVILGAKAPIVLTSRSDSHETKQNSIKLAAIGA